MSWILIETCHRKVLKTFDDAIEAAEYCSNYDEMKKLILENTTVVEPPWEEFSSIPHLEIENTEYNWGLLMYHWTPDRWEQVSRADICEKDLINPELQHRMWQIANHMEPTKFIPFEERLAAIPDDYEYPF